MRECSLRRPIASFPVPNKRNGKDVTLETISFRLSDSSCDHDELSYVMRCLQRMTKCQNAMIKRNKRTRFTVKSAFSSSTIVAGE